VTHQAVLGYVSEPKGTWGTGTLKVMVRFGRNFRGHRCPAEEVSFFGKIDLARLILT